MTGDEQDVVLLEKILVAAEEIKGMAEIRPAEAAAMLEQARHLIELAEQMRSDWLRSQGATRATSAAMLSFERKSTVDNSELGSSGFGSPVARSAC